MTQIEQRKPVEAHRAVEGVPVSWRGLDAPQLWSAIERAADAGHELRATRGRRTHAFEVDGQRLVAKRFRGDEPRDWWFERLRGVPTDAARREWRALERVLATGLAAPRPLVVLFEAPSGVRPPRPGSGARALLVLEWIDHDSHLGRLLAETASSGPDAARRRRELVERTCRSVAHLHAHGLYHRDLYASHLVRRSGSDELVLLDHGRTRWERRPRERWLIKDLAALHGSTAGLASDRERLRFLSRWRRATGRTTADARRMVPAILRKAERLFAHRPVDPGTDRVGWPSGSAERGVEGGHPVDAGGAGPSIAVPRAREARA
ncbi:Lipopolysaccharide core heptose(I) kinase RfaP [Planctomycetes bacterium Pla163]|uniref:Lipopolysaccharide core heptose(I) kinase RfaP n=1 Tax=Rohdeia mirabilis TaxID=2528008 RepID=A0A518D310_9BACT|nr:Lipopolysaccharide core heptose(I) kinase RfaP [Planctomycetes bacterium Pla163]